MERQDRVHLKDIARNGSGSPGWAKSQRLVATLEGRSDANRMGAIRDTFSAYRRVVLRPYVPSGTCACEFVRIIIMLLDASVQLTCSKSRKYVRLPPAIVSGHRQGHRPHSCTGALHAIRLSLSPTSLIGLSSGHRLPLPTVTLAAPV